MEKVEDNILYYIQRPAFAQDICNLTAHQCQRRRTMVAGTKGMASTAMEAYLVYSIVSGSASSYRWQNVCSQARSTLYRHDNVQPHTTRLTTKSTELNPVKHLCDKLDRRVRQLYAQPHTFPQLAQAPQADWATILHRLICNLVASVCRRCQPNGCDTRY